MGDFMQLKLYKRNTFLLFLIIFLLAVTGVILYFNREAWINHKEMVFVTLIFIMMFVSWFFTWYEANADKRIIEKMVMNKQIALARITNGGFNRIIRNARLQKNVLWQLDIDLYDNDMNLIKTSFIEKLVPSQTSIPQGFVYVTYDPTQPEKIFVVPNAMISMYPDLKEIVDKYENNKNLNINYLNAYYNNGIVLKTFKQSIKEERK